jgi:UrcA family protein
MTTATSNLTHFRRSLAVAAASAALTVATTSFAAQPSSDPPSVSVRYDDLNLSTAAGVNALYQRISTAARAVCPDVHSRDLGVAAAGERCKASAVAHAVSDLHNPQLALLHASRVSRG